QLPSGGRRQLARCLHLCRLDERRRRDHGARRIETAAGGALQGGGQSKLSPGSASVNRPAVRRIEFIGPHVLKLSPPHTRERRLYLARALIIRLMRSRRREGRKRIRRPIWLPTVSSTTLAKGEGGEIES